MCDVDEINSHAQRVRVAGNVDVRRLIPEKIRFDVSGDVPTSNIGIHAETEARVLGAEAGLLQLCIGRICVREGRKAGPNIAPVSRGPRYGRKIHKSKWSKEDGTDLKGERRLSVRRGHQP